jgi:autotransporter strand-loop-strand O-heptosyltransferase
MKNNIELKINYLDGCMVEIVGEKGVQYNESETYEVLFINNQTGKLLHHANLKPNYWTKPSIQYFVEWKIVVLKNNVGVIHEEIINLRDKEVLITIQNTPLGDNIAWVAYANEFAKKHNCKVTLQFSLKDLFEDTYPNINMVDFGNYQMDDEKFYASYRMVYGKTPEEQSILLNELYKKKKRYLEGLTLWNTDSSPKHPNLVPLQEFGATQIGLEYKEIKPLIQNISDERPIKNKYICISEFASGPIKQWNNPVGWEKLIQMLKLYGYEIVSISKEKSDLKGITKLNGDLPLSNRAWYLKHCDFFIGMSSGLSWLSWACNTKVVMISGVTIKENEFSQDCVRIYNDSVCHGCWNSPKHCDKFVTFLKDFCPENKRFECTRTISPTMVMNKILENNLIKN